jgi:hypothetical protein
MEISIRLAMPPALIDLVNGRLSDGGSVLIEAGLLRPDGAHASSWAIDSENGAILAPRWSTDAMEPAQVYPSERLAQGAEVATLVGDWNSPVGSGGVRDDFDAYLESAQFGPVASVPQVGTDEWWEAAPAECRTYADAPADVLKGLDSVTIRIAVPKEGFPVDSVICLRDEVAGMGCSATRRGSSA